MDNIASQLLREDAVAERLNVPGATLRAWRREGRGPAYIRLGRLIRYSSTDVERWVQQHSVGRAS